MKELIQLKREPTQANLGQKRLKTTCHSAAKVIMKKGQTIKMVISGAKNGVQGGRALSTVSFFLVFTVSCRLMFHSLFYFGARVTVFTW